ncbi:hypothetical protein AA313_de0200233 [Arthrobotrys entomopaga]|nr:hypothetical protein AA313_de0200233 [Arthrobotrys entomopaga]
MDSSHHRGLLLLIVSAIWLVVGSASPTRMNPPLSLGNATPPVRRATSQDPSCPVGWLCVKQSCPGEVVCASGESCINFEGVIACAPTGSSWCAINPTTYQGVGCASGNCCHGNCYVSGAVCCDNPAVTCSIGTLCNVCPPAQACTTGATTCISKGSPSSTTTKPTTTSSRSVVTTTSQSSITVVVTPTTVPLNFDASCSNDQKDMIRSEAAFAYNMAVAAQSNLQHGDYYNHFFAQSLRNNAQFALDTAETFRLIADILTGKSSEFQFLVTCDNTSPSCRIRGDYASMNDNTFIMNFCARFFKSTAIFKGTQELLDSCGTIDLRAAQRSRSAVIIHECTHTTYAMRGNAPSRDYAYGYNGCTQLPLGEFDRSCAQYAASTAGGVLCPTATGAEGVCPAEFSAQNADTYAHVAAGIYFTQRCSRDIPYPPPSAPGTKRAVARRSDICPLVDDYILWDGADPDDTSIAITGYVHFGDSYASGMGTGETSTDSCRVGSNNYGDLLYQWLNDNSISYERHSCSGDTTDGLNNQIQKWNNAAVSSVGTVTIGGNDLGFSDLVYYCVITPNTARLGSTNRANCVDAENKARAHMTDSSDQGLQAKFTAAYLNILNKANSRAFQLYVTSYPLFFNQDTTDCQFSSFHYWWGAYNPPSDWPTNRIVYLTVDLRVELNALVTQLNGVILKAVQAANAAHGGNQVHFVDVVDSFNSHHWCENGVHEPDPSSQSTWFFLSAWNDLRYNTAAEESGEVSTLLSDGTMKLPDASTCVTDPAAQLDPYLVAMCRVAQAISEDPTGPEAVRFNNANADIVAGNVSSQSIPWYVPTRQIKTFHPRTPGMFAFRDAIISSLQDNGQL